MTFPSSPFHFHPTHTKIHKYLKILEIITLRKQGLRGQAWVVFSSVSTATSALQAEQNFTFFGKNLKIEYAREKTDRVAKLDGTYVPKDRRKAKREREAAEAVENAKRIKLDDGGADNSGGGGGGAAERGVKVEDPSSLVPSEGDGKTTSATQSSGEAVETPPSNILFAESLPKDCTEMMLACLFRSYPGYKEVRMPRSGLAFIEFDDEPHASVALKALNGFNLSATEALNLKYGKA